MSAVSGIDTLQVQSTGIRKQTIYITMKFAKENVIQVIEALYFLPQGADNLVAINL